MPHDYEIQRRYPIREGLAEVIIASPPGKFAEPITSASRFPSTKRRRG
jgi:hypothetical protein